MSKLFMNIAIGLLFWSYFARSQETPQETTNELPTSVHGAPPLDTLVAQTHDSTYSSGLIPISLEEDSSG